MTPLASRLLPRVSNSQPLPLREVPLVPFDEFNLLLYNHLREGCVLSALFGRPGVVCDGVRLYAAVSDPRDSTITLFATDVGERYPALTLRSPQAHWFEREIAEQWGVVPEGHPWFKPIRFHSSYRPGHDAWGRSDDAPILCGVTDYFGITGDEIHEVGVGPIHAGVIEPGHFRFQCHGEIVFHLEISLGYQHRGIEKKLAGGPHPRMLHYMETLAGDTSIGHATAYCQAVEGLAGCEVPRQAQSLRAIALELERMANHTGDLGALAQDVGFLPTASFNGRLRGDFLNLSATICGNRFGRSLVRPGGVRWDVDAARAENMRGRVDTALRDVTGSVKLLWSTASVMARFEETGTVSRQFCDELGLVGMAARACGVERDIRRDFPTGLYRSAPLPVATWPTGDVFARANVRWLEIQHSCRFLREQLAALPGGEIQTPVGALQPDSIAVSLVEGWRGEICHVAITDTAGKFAHYKVVDPSFHNWIGLAMALRDQQISDFPVNNKSFNLSYCGHDL